MHLGLSKIVAVANPRREQPLSDDEELELTLHLNSFYLHIRGCLDNLAWCLVHELQLFGASVQEETIKREVDLFNKKFLRKLKRVLPGLSASVDQHKQWQCDLKTIRDPVTHRIPIYAVPTVLSPEEEERYQVVYQRAEEARAKGDFDLADRLYRELDGIGRYVPYFAQSPSTGARKVYPQVANDLSVVLELADDVIAHLERHGA